MSTAEFVPRWASPPGDTIRDLLRERRLDVDAAARTLDLSAPDLESLLDGGRRITVELARRLVDAFGGSIEFWVARDAQYLDDRERVAADVWASSLPIAEMVSYGWIRRPGDWVERLEAALEFFDVDGPAEWDATVARRAARYRTTAVDGLPVPKVAAWLRAAELAARDVHTGEWSPEAFRAGLADMRRLTVERDPRAFVPELQRLAAPAGVVVSVVRAPTGCRVSGAARLLDDGRRQIVLSVRHRADDHLWFTFFHEVGHLLLHRLDDGYLDEIDPAASADGSSIDEDEANEFAAETLVPRALIDQLQWKRWPTAREVIGLARRAGVSPGVVVGQLQHHGQLGFATKLNGLKRRYEWNGTALERLHRPTATS